MNVHCAACDQPWQPADPGVILKTDPRPAGPDPNRWQCADLFACRRRKTARDKEVAAMYRALDQVWESLARDGWRWPAP